MGRMLIAILCLDLHRRCGYKFSMEMLKRLIGPVVNFARSRLFGALTLVAVASANPAAATCRQALALGLDISGSVDVHEYRLQLDGLAAALLNPVVRQAFLVMPEINVRLYVYEWGAEVGQNVLVPWTEIRGLQDLQDVADTLRAHKRIPKRLPTALGNAMLFGANALSDQSDCWRRTLDISGDGRSNVGPTPRMVSGADVLQGVTINALVIGNEWLMQVERYAKSLGKLGVYFQNEVIRGPDAFVELAVDFAGFEEAMTNKLLKELQVRSVGSVVGVDR